MGVVAVACVAVVSAPMLGARGGVHHRGGRPAERHQYLSGIDFSQDATVAEAMGSAGIIMLAHLDTGALAGPKAPPESSDEGSFSPFIAIVPPSFGPGRGLQQPTAPQQTPPETPPIRPLEAHAASAGLTPAVAEETPPDVPPPVLPPEPVVVPEPPVPPVPPIVVVETPPPAPPGPPPPPENRPQPVVVTQTLTAPIVAAVVPEPATWAMLVLGFGAIGAAIRRRRRMRVVAGGSC